MKPLLSVLIVNYNSSDFVGASLFALLRLTKNPYQVFILDNNSALDDYNNLLNIVRPYNNVFVERSETGQTGEVAHGTGLNTLCKKVNTPFFSILDADAIWLKKDWDATLIRQLNDKVKIIGTQLLNRPDKPEDFPVVFAALFETQTFQKLNIDFTPQSSFGIGVGNELRPKYLDSGYRGEVIEMKNTRSYKQGPFKDIICAEYYLRGDYNNIFACHFSRGSTLGIAKFLGGQANVAQKILYRAPVLGKYMLVKRGKKEKYQWLDICRSIIDSQGEEK